MGHHQFPGCGARSSFHRYEVAESRDRAPSLGFKAGTTALELALVATAILIAIIHFVP